jgi:hypothetical protein
MGYSCEENFHHTFHILRNMIWVLVSGTERRELPLVVWRHDGGPLDVGQNGAIAVRTDLVQHRSWTL